MSEEPLFDPSLKKRKKKQVAFTEDPLGADADPTTPAPVTIESVATNGDAVDMGPKTVHEQMAQNERAGEGEDAEKKEDDEFKAMFGDMKKKKKKKDIPLDLVRRVYNTLSCRILLTFDLSLSKTNCITLALYAMHTHDLTICLRLSRISPHARSLRMDQAPPLQ